MVKLFMLVVCLLLGACATNFVEPTSGDVATIYATDKGGLIRFFDNENCDNLRLQPGLDARRPVKVPAGKPLFLGRGILTTGMVSVQCSTRFTFVPEAGATYELGWEMTPVPLSCRTPVSRIVEGGRKVPEPSAKSFVSGPGCANLY